jgi:tRNA modification GTPase
MTSPAPDYYRETIAAIVTPPGEGGLGAIRIAGADSSKILNSIFRPARKQDSGAGYFILRYGYVVDCYGNTIDEVTAVEMPAGRSYTGQEQAEIFCHGGQFVLKRILKEIIALGARLAEPGEFTRRAFLAGRIDLAKAEAVADLIAAKTAFSYESAKNDLIGAMSEKIDGLREKMINILAEIEASVDYPEEEPETADREKMIASMEGIVARIEELAASYRSGRIIKEGFGIAVAGRPNAGKSSLFNLLLNQNRAIVAPVPGTTRDYLTEWIDLEGVAVSLTDTAGLRTSRGAIEKSGQESARRIMIDSDLIIWIVDVSRKNFQTELENDLKKLVGLSPVKIVFNKIDKLSLERLKAVKMMARGFSAVIISCKTKDGLDNLRDKLVSHVSGSLPDLTDGLVVTSERHKQKLDLALESLKQAETEIKRNQSPEIIAFNVRRAVNEIDEISGRIYNEEILDRIFSRFCIGK